ncbi:LysR family transcriptional regulator [Saliniramus sp.]|uniref:LysR family transcriptional regulator n=1 Tax=Saliniramus sp. TaxID=2986772 RepID=UPI002BB1F748|nr:LysR family transcriptional regulator [Saliniramus sp.]HMB11874.1 LysR family transcriptional regulator [Saliniramus sp.]
MDLIGDLELFEALARHGSFSAVARRRGQAVSSISRRLDRLEEALGQRLFNRLPTGLHLTTAGRIKLGEARGLTLAARAFSEKQTEVERLSGHVGLAAPTRLGEIAVAPILADFLPAHPGISVELHLSDRFQDLDRDQIDIALRIGGHDADHHIPRRVAPNRRILVAAPGYLENHASISAPADLAAHEGLWLGDALRWSLRGPDGEQASVTPRRRVTNLSGDALTRLCIAGLGVALKSSWDVQGEVAAGRLVRVLPDWEQAQSADIRLITPARRLTPRPVRALMQALQQGLLAVLDGEG